MGVLGSQWGEPKRDELKIFKRIATWGCPPNAKNYNLSLVQDKQFTVVRLIGPSHFLTPFPLYKGGSFQAMPAKKGSQELFPHAL